MITRDGKKIFRAEQSAQAGSDLAKAFSTSKPLDGNLTSAKHDLSSAPGTPPGIQQYGEILKAIDALREEVFALIPSISDGNASHKGKQIPSLASTDPGDSSGVKVVRRTLCDMVGGTEAAQGEKPSSIEDRDGDLKKSRKTLKVIFDDTERATTAIIKASEAIEEAAIRLRAQKLNHEQVAIIDELTEQTTRVFEACNFQDITGQRIVKIIDMLRLVDSQIHQMIKILDRNVGEKLEKSAIETLRNIPEGEVLHGPGLPGTNDISQKEIDDIFGNEYS